MSGRTPLTILTGPLGSGKTTLLRHILAAVPRRIAILMNEFGEIAIDSKILQGTNVEIADLGGGCVCCSLLGDFEAAVDEILATIDPEQIIVETTGVAEPDALVFDIQESLPQVRLDGVVTVIDADGLVQYPRVGHTTRIQIEAADILILNKVDLISEQNLLTVTDKLRSLNEIASIVWTIRSQIDPDLLFGIGRERSQAPPQHHHQPEFDSFSYTTPVIFDPACFTAFVHSLSPDVYRAKGFVQFPEGTHLFNFVAGRWELEPFEPTSTELVFIGKNIAQQQAQICQRLQSCEQP